MNCSWVRTERAIRCQACRIQNALCVTSLLSFRCGLHPCLVGQYYMFVTFGSFFFFLTSPKFHLSRPHFAERQPKDWRGEGERGCENLIKKFGWRWKLALSLLSLFLLSLLRIRRGGKEEEEDQLLEALLLKLCLAFITPSPRERSCFFGGGMSICQTCTTANPLYSSRSACLFVFFWGGGKNAAPMQSISFPTCPIWSGHPQE